MARSRRRSANRSNGTARSWNLATLAKIGSGLAVAAGGTYGVFYTYSQMSRQQNVTAGVEVGVLAEQSDVALAQKPPLPDDPAGFRLASNGSTMPAVGPSSFPTTPSSNFPSSLPGNDPINPAAKNPVQDSSVSSSTARNIFADAANNTSAADNDKPSDTTNKLADKPALPGPLKSPGDSPGAIPSTFPDKLPNTLSGTDSAASLAASSNTPSTSNPSAGAARSVPALPPVGSSENDPLAAMLKQKPLAPTGSPEPAKAGGGLPPLPPSSAGSLVQNSAAPSNNLLSAISDSAQRNSNPSGTSNPLPSGSSSGLPTVPSALPSASNSGIGGAGRVPGSSGLSALAANDLRQPSSLPEPSSSTGNPRDTFSGLPETNRSMTDPTAFPAAPPTGNQALSSSPSFQPPAAPPTGNPLNNPSLASSPNALERTASPLPSASSPIGIPGTSSNPAMNRSVPNRLASDPMGATNPSANPPNPGALTGGAPVRPVAFPETQSVPAAQRPLNQSLVSNQPGDPRWEIQQSAAVIIEKHAPQQVQVGVPTQFVLVVRNVGRVPAAQVLVRDRVPEGAQLVQASPKPDRQQGDLLEWDIAALPPGETLQITTELIPTRAGELGSVAEVSLAAVAACRTRSMQPKLVIEHTAPPQILVGQQVVMNITVRNDGDGPAENVVIRETVPDGLKHPSGTEIENPIGRLMPGQSRVLQLPLLAVSPGQVQNVVRVTGEGKLVDQHTINVQVVAPQLQVNVDGPGRRYLQRQAVHELQVRNAGSANATNVQMMARLPRGLKYESSSPAGRYDPSRHAVFWAMQQLPSGQSETLTLTTLPLAPGEQAIEFQALADLNQPQSSVQKMVVEQLSELFFEIDDVQDPIEINSTTTYVVRLENQGSQVANNVSLVANLPPGLVQLKVDSPVQYQARQAANGGQQIVFAPIPVLNPEEKIAIQIQVQGKVDGDHRVEVQLTSAERPTAVAKQESTKVYSDLR